MRPGKKPASANHPPCGRRCIPGTPHGYTLLLPLVSKECTPCSALFPWHTEPFCIHLGLELGCLVGRVLVSSYQLMRADLPNFVFPKVLLVA